MELKIFREPTRPKNGVKWPKVVKKRIIKHNEVVTVKSDPKIIDKKFKSSCSCAFKNQRRSERQPDKVKRSGMHLL